MKIIKRVLSIGLVSVFIPVNLACANSPSFAIATTDESASWFVYIMDHGTTSQDTVVVKNTSTETITLSLYPADRETPSSTDLPDTFILKSHDAEMTTIGKWVTLDSESVTLAPDEEKLVNFTLAIPSGTAQQEYSGGIIAELDSNTDTDGTSINIGVRVGVRIYVDVKNSTSTATTTTTTEETIVAVSSTSSAENSSAAGGGSSQSEETTDLTTETTDSETQLDATEDSSIAEESDVTAEATPEETGLDYTGHWAEDYIQVLVDRGVVFGYADAPEGYEVYYAPDNNLTRAELAKIVVNLFEYVAPHVKEMPFVDVDVDEWYAPFVAKLKDLGVVEGYADGTYGPNQAITRAEAMKILLGGASKDAENYIWESNPFDDIDTDEWYAPYVLYAYDHGYVSGYKDADGNLIGKFGPLNNITRGEMSKMAVEVASLMD